MKKLFSFVLLAVMSFGLAQPNIVFSPQTIVVNPKPSFTVETFVDKDPSGNGTPTYQVGEDIRIGVRTSSSAYIYLFNVRATGEINQILPNKLDTNGQNNFVNAGETKLFPPEGARYTFGVEGPQGLDKVIAVASKDPLNTSQLASFSSDPNFASSNIGEQGFAQTLSIIIRPKPQNSWVTDTAIFNVGSAPATPRYGTININSTPSGAEAFVDGQFVGFTPVNFATTTGSHTVEVRAAGYNTYSQAVNVPGGQTASINAPLQAVVRTGTVNFVSQPAGAQVFVDGEYRGVTPTGPLSINAGSHAIRFVLNGYSEATTSINVTAGVNQTVTGNMRALSGALVTRANLGGALIFINGQQVGTVTKGSGVNTFQNLPAGQHELTVVAPGFRTFVSNFTITGGQTSEIRITQASIR